MELVVGTVLEGDLVLEEDLGGGRGFRARSARGPVRILPGWTGSRQEPGGDANLPGGVLAPVARGEGWVALPWLPVLLGEANEGRLPPTEALQFGSQLLTRLDDLQRIGQLHLGLHPDLLYRGEDGNLVLGGLEVDLGDEAYQGYRPLDQRSRGEGTPASVTYGAGATLFTLLSGGRPRFPGDSVSRGRPEVPPWLDRVVSLAMEADPNHRYRDLKTFRAALGAAGSALALARRRDPKASALGLEPGPRPGPGLGPGAMSPRGRHPPGGGGSPMPFSPGNLRETMDRLEQEHQPARPRYRFSWRVTLTRGVPFLVLLAGGGYWFLAWLWSLLSGAA